ncbi:DUF4148 domain-containing protein [Achromobacter pestifer]|uniref:DUF4148 domain-containing protein n=1 Tax=Achromobacter pestifer TaxID=1353889 RepID=A0A7D4HTM9_9BURK|nr:DUF4148 domain-containing protein [Achromobacter pestifer]QKH36133.1 DUF4148 domain-containing protein [Achromobacter pestifer]
MRIKTFSLASAAAIVIGIFSSSATASEETQVPPPKPSELTRADRVADLQAWRASGLDELSRGESSPDIYGAEYRERYATYLRLRAEARQQSAPG